MYVKCNDGSLNGDVFHTILCCVGWKTIQVGVYNGWRNLVDTIYADVILLLTVLKRGSSSSGWTNMGAT